jgi:hypothetical protein
MVLQFQGLISKIAAVLDFKEKSRQDALGLRWGPAGAPESRN